MIQRLCSSAVCLVVLRFLSPLAFAVPATQMQQKSVRQRCLDQAHWESKPLIIAFNRPLQRELSFFNRREQEASLHNSPSSRYLVDRYNICARVDPREHPDLTCRPEDEWFNH